MEFATAVEKYHVPNFRTHKVSKALGRGQYGQVDLVRFTCSAGHTCQGARKTLVEFQRKTASEDPERTRRHARLQAKEAMLMLIMQNRAWHPSGQCCPYLPFLLAVNTDTAASLATDPQKPLMYHPEEKIITEMVVQFGERGSLHRLICHTQHEYHNGLSLEPTLPEPQVWRLAAGIAKGLLHFHQGGWAHTDIKPDNIVLHRDFRPMIVDFGLALKLDNFTSLPGGTPGFMPPEVVQARRSGSRFFVTEKVDVFAFGVTLLMMVLPDFATKPQATGLSKEEHEKRWRAGTLPQLLVHGCLTCCNELRRIIQISTRPEPHSRPCIADICSMLNKGLAMIEQPQMQSPDQMPGALRAPMATAAPGPAAHKAAAPLQGAAVGKGDCCEQMLSAHRPPVSAWNTCGALRSAAGAHEEVMV